MVDVLFFTYPLSKALCGAHLSLAVVLPLEMHNFRLAHIGIYCLERVWSQGAAREMFKRVLICP